MESEEAEEVESYMSQDMFLWLEYCRAADERERKRLGITDEGVFLGIAHHFNFVIASDE